MDKNNRLIGLITDFGPKGSHYIAAMKAVIISINPEARIIDIHHNISSYSVVETSFIIKTIYNFFPQNSIFVVVVDPGVGSSRKILALKTKSNHYFIGPDNGIFWLAFAESGIKECIQIQNKQFYHQPVSDTFHGRDIMAPIGAYLSKNISLNKFGPRLDPKDLTSYPITYDISKKDKSIHCTIQYIDNFGNIVTNIPIIDEKIKDTNFMLQKGSILMLKTDENKYQGILQSEYKNTEINQLFFIKGSSGYLEISMNQESAAKKLNLQAGDSIQIRLKSV
jgi:S-adenosylmethionine hydrolase